MTNKNIYWRILSFCLIIFGSILLVCCVLPANKNIVTQRFSSEQNTSSAVVKIAIDYPVSGPEKSLENIRQGIINNLHAKTTLKTSEISEILNNITKQKHASMSKDNRFENGTKYQAELLENISKVAETDNFITFVHRTYIFEGGAHGLTATDMLTYQKSDGKQINNLILKQPLQHEFKQLLSQGVKAYFASFGENAGHFTDFDINNLPLPENKPFLTDEGVGFIYSQYEIAPYASGQPAFVVPYSQIKPYLSDEIIKLVPVDDKKGTISAYKAAEYF